MPLKYIIELNSFEFHKLCAILRKSAGWFEGMMLTQLDAQMLLNTVMRAKREEPYSNKIPQREYEEPVETGETGVRADDIDAIIRYAKNLDDY